MKTQIAKAVLGSIAILALAPLAQAGTARLELNNYLQQVKQNHMGLKGAQETAEGALLRSREGELLIAPVVFANAQLSSDARQSPFFRYEKAISNNYSLGVSQMTTFGMQAKLSYNLNYTNYVGLPAAVTGGAPANFHQGQPALEISQSLWRNGFGAETRATQNMLSANALIKHYSESYSTKMILSGAEGSYWRLALARQNVTVSREALERTKKILDWASRRSQLQLADRADSIQAESAYEIRKLNLQAAIDEERVASRAFNQARGVDSDRVYESLEALEKDWVSQLRVPKRAEFRDDVKAAQQAERAASANAEASISRDKPTFDVYGSYALNSREAALGDGISKSFTNDYPTKAIGVRLSAPINIGVTQDAHEGWRKERIGAETALQRKLFEQEQDWINLNESLIEAKRRLELSQSIENIQGKKLGHERDRLNRGRTTTYQVINFEEDFAQAQLNRIRAQAAVLQIIAQMKTFGGSL